MTTTQSPQRPQQVCLPSQQYDYQPAPLPSPTLSHHQPYFPTTAKQSLPQSQALPHPHYPHQHYHEQSPIMQQQQQQTQQQPQMLIAGLSLAEQQQLQQLSPIQQQQFLAYKQQQELAFAHEQQRLLHEQQQHHHQQQQQQNALATHDYNYRPNRNGAGATHQETSAYIGQFGLLAEAAKRAQMAVLERDLGSVEL